MTPPTVTTDLLAYNFNMVTPDLASLLRGRPLDHLGQSFMHDLAREGDVLSAEALFEAGLDIDRADDEGRRPMHEAAFAGQLEMVQFLHGAGAILDAPIHPFGYTALYYAVQQGHIDVASYLLEQGARIDVTERLSGQSLLHTSAARGDMAMAGILIAAGIDVLAEDTRGQTARDHAARGNHKELERCLLKVMQHHAVYGGI
ncbi:MAG: ankyrin repeat domain-containing protein [Bdellovibrionales bacterium]|jgi:ankyrin repeat protein|nr:ankyrin repeat domain-containing protein [Bdellovibrionales bacterium]